MVCSGREFQVWAAATGKARLPMVASLTGGTMEAMEMEVDGGHLAAHSKPVGNVPPRCTHGERCNFENTTPPRPTE